MGVGRVGVPQILLQRTVLPKPDVRFLFLVFWNHCNEVGSINSARYHFNSFFISNVSKYY